MSYMEPEDDSFETDYTFSFGNDGISAKCLKNGEQVAMATQAAASNDDIDKDLKKLLTIVDHLT